MGDKVEASLPPFADDDPRKPSEDEAPVGILEWAQRNYPEGYDMNGAGQRIPRPHVDLGNADRD